MDQALAGDNSSVPTQPAEVRVEPQRWRARHLEVCDSVPCFRRPRETANDRAILGRDDNNPDPYCCRGATLHDAQGMQSAAEHGPVAVPADRRYQGVQMLGNAVNVEIVKRIAESLCRRRIARCKTAA